MKRVLPSAIVLFWSFSLFSQVDIDDFHLKSHIFIGNLFGSDDFNEIYSSKTLSGLDMLIGYKQAFVVGSFKKLNASGDGKTSEIPGGSKATWSEEFRSIGLRCYGSEKVFNLFVDGRFEQANVTEQIKTNNPAYSPLNSKLDLKKCKGFSGMVGAEVKIWIISVEGTVGYSYIPTPDSYSEEYGKKNVGGFISTIGIGLSI